MSNKRYYLALNRVQHVGPQSIKKLIQHFPNLEDVFKSSFSELIQLGIKAPAAKAIQAFDFSIINEDLAWERQTRHHLLTWEDKRYPALLRQIYDPPAVLYAKGDLSALHQPMLAMVGSRKPTATGAQTARKFAFELAQNKVTIVSGLALGIDGAAHQGCLQAKGKTIAVLGTGIDRIYPWRHKEIFQEIAQDGLLLSEYPFGTAPSPGHFPRRNRIISGLSLATLVVEAAIKSGSLVTARMALEQDRDVLAIPGSINSPQSRGCNHLLKQGAKLVTSLNDVLSELNLSFALLAEEKSASSHVLENDPLVCCIGYDVTSIDQIIEQSGFSFEKVTCDLANLEIQGVVQSVPGGYMRCTP